MSSSRNTYSRVPLPRLLVCGCALLPATPRDTVFLAVAVTDDASLESLVRATACMVGCVWGRRPVFSRGRWHQGEREGTRRTDHQTLRWPLPPVVPVRFTEPPCRSPIESGLSSHASRLGWPRCLLSPTQYGRSDVVPVPREHEAVRVHLLFENPAPHSPEPARPSCWGREARRSRAR